MNIFNIESTFVMKKERGWNTIYVMVDLHGTIIPSGKTVNDIEDQTEFYPHAKEVLQRLSIRNDMVLILWSSIPKNRAVKVLSWLNSHEINFKYFNENPEAKSTARSEFSGKFYFNIALDDRAGFDPMIDWKNIKDELIRLGEWELTDSNSCVKI